MDGSATYASIALGNLKSWEMEGTRGAIDTTVKGDKHQQVAGGLVTHRVRLSALLDYVTGQQDVIDFLEAATPDVTTGALVLTVATGKTFTYSSALYLGHTITSPEGDNPVAITMEFQPLVAGTPAWA